MAAAWGLLTGICPCHRTGGGGGAGAVFSLSEGWAGRVPAPVPQSEGTEVQTELRCPDFQARALSTLLPAFGSPAPTPRKCRAADAVAILGFGRADVGLPPGSPGYRVFFFFF